MNTVPKEDFRDILITAIEGGISYWICDSDEFRKVKITDVRDPDGSISHYSRITFESDVLGEGWQKFEVSPETLEEKFEEFLDSVLDSHREYLEEAVEDGELAGSVDADYADMMFQFAAFDEVIFG